MLLAAQLPAKTRIWHSSDQAGVMRMPQATTKLNGQQLSCAESEHE